MIIELTEQEINNLLIILANTTFKGSDWKLIGDLETKLRQGLEVKKEQ